MNALFAGTGMLMLLTTVGPAASTDQAKVPDLRGPYLGQEPPGQSAQPFAPDVLSVESKNQHTLSFSTDGSELYFSRYPEHVTLVTRQVNGVWQPPEKAPFECWEAIFRPDGQSLVCGDGDLWIVRRSPTGWYEREKLEGDANTAAREYYSSSSSDGTLYFSRLVEERQMMFRSRLSGTTVSGAQPLEAIVNGESAFHPFIAPDGSFLLFNSSGRPDGLGKADIYVAFRLPDRTFGAPINLGSGVNSIDSDLCPVLSPDGKYIFFTRLGPNHTGTPYWVSARVIDQARGRPASEERTDK